MLKNSKIMGFVATSRPEISKQFYEEILGLTLIEDTPFAIVLESGNATVRIQKTR